ncbi:MAG: FKBP-type peptidyl-prolyl cis-trans isomerase [Bacteroidota bacterium]
MRAAVCLLFLSFLLVACGGQSSPAADSAPPEQDVPPPIKEDDLLMQLSAYLSTDTSRAAREQNDIIDYAIDNLLPLEATNSGLFYQVLSEGDGEPIAWGDFLSAHYKGYLLDGKVFADSRAQDRTLEFYVGNMIDAWNEGLQLINVGGRIQLLVPSQLGYGEDGLMSSFGRTIVPPHQILVFEVEVLEKQERQ